MAAFNISFLALATLVSFLGPPKYSAVYYTPERVRALDGDLLTIVVYYVIIKHK